MKRNGKLYYFCSSRSTTPKVELSQISINYGIQREFRSKRSRPALHASRLLFEDARGLTSSISSSSGQRNCPPGGGRSRRRWGGGWHHSSLICTQRPDSHRPMFPRPDRACHIPPAG